MMHITEIYCENQRCNVRQIEIVTKDHGDQPDPKTWNCPGCGKKAKLHWRRSSAEHRKIELEDAIGVVNSALYQREYINPEHPNWPVAFPISALLLSELPEAWKCQP